MGEDDCDNKWWIFSLTRFHIKNNTWVHTSRILDKFRKEIKLKINLWNHPVHWYEMDSNKHSKQLMCYYMLLLNNNYFFASKTSSIDGRCKIANDTGLSPLIVISQVSPRNFLLVCMRAMGTFPIKTCHRLWFLCLVACSEGIAFGSHC